MFTWYKEWRNDRKKRREYRRAAADMIKYAELDYKFNRPRTWVDPGKDFEEKELRALRGDVTDYFPKDTKV